MGDLLDYSGLYQLLTDLVAKKQTCTLFGRTDNNRAVMIGILGGEIVTLSCAGRRGGAAIPALRQVSTLTIRVDDGVAQGAMALPTTAEILSDLMPTAMGGNLTGINPPPEVAQGSRGDGAKLCELLARFIGPIAPVLCSESIRAAGGLEGEAQKQGVILILAREIDDEAEAKQFVDSAREILGVS
jgi:hypothetical protein